MLRDGTDGAIITYGGTMNGAIEISENLKAKGCVYGGCQYAMRECY